MIDYKPPVFERSIGGGPAVSRGGESDLARRVRESLERHPLKPLLRKKRSDSDCPDTGSGGVYRRYREVAAEVGCSVGAVQMVADRIKNCEIGKERNRKVAALAGLAAPALDPELENAKAQQFVDGFLGWQFVFCKLNVLINSYLQIARVSGAIRSESWLVNMRDLCDKAQEAIKNAEEVNRMFGGNGAPPGSGNLQRWMKENPDLEERLKWNPV